MTGSEGRTVQALMERTELAEMANVQEVVDCLVTGETLGGRSTIQTVK